jgi:hypothetical protein
MHMRILIFLVPRLPEYSLDGLGDAIEQLGFSVDRRIPGDLLVSDGVSHVWLFEAGRLEDNYEPEEIEVVERLIKGPKVLGLRMGKGSEEMTHRILMRVGDDMNIVLDNSHDTILRGSEFVRRVRENPEWVWWLGQDL